MTDSVRLGRILGIPIGASWTIIALAAVFTGTLALQSFPLYAPGTGLGPRTGAALVAVAGLFVSIVAHELGHAVVAMNHGVGVWGISLWLLGGVAKLDRPAPSPRAEFRIAVAGPAVSLLAALFFGSVAVLADTAGAGRLTMAVLTWLAGVNAILAVFNLLPAAPLDGGRVLTAWLWRSSGDAERARVLTARCGLVLGAALIAAGGVQVLARGQLGGLVTALVGGFVLLAAREEVAASVIRGRLAALRASDLMVARPTPVPDTVTLHQLDQWFTGDGAGVAHPVVRWTDEPIGWIVPEAHRELPAAARSWTQVHEVMRPPDAVHHVSHDTPVPELLDRWNGTGQQILVVHDGGGRRVGSISDRQVQPLLARPDFWGRPRSAAVASDPIGTSRHAAASGSLRATGPGSAAAFDPAPSGPALPPPPTPTRPPIAASGRAG